MYFSASIKKATRFPADLIPKKFTCEVPLPANGIAKLAPTSVVAMSVASGSAVLASKVGSETWDTPTALRNLAGETDTEGFGIEVGTIFLVCGVSCCASGATIPTSSDTLGSGTITDRTPSIRIKKACTTNATVMAEAFCAVIRRCAGIGAASPERASGETGSSPWFSFSPSVSDVACSPSDFATAASLAFASTGDAAAFFALDFFLEGFGSGVGTLASSMGAVARTGASSAVVIVFAAASGVSSASSGSASASSWITGSGSSSSSSSICTIKVATSSGSSGSTILASSSGRAITGFVRRTNVSAAAPSAIAEGTTAFIPGTCCP